MHADTAVGRGSGRGRRPAAADSKRVLRGHVTRVLRRGTESVFVDMSAAMVRAAGELAGVPVKSVTVNDVRWAFPTVPLELGEWFDRGFIVDDDETLWRYIGGRSNVITVGLGGTAWLFCSELDGRDYWTNNEGIMFPPVPTSPTARIRRVRQFIRDTEGVITDPDDAADEDAYLHTLTGFSKPVIADIRAARLRGWRRAPRTATRRGGR